MIKRLILNNLVLVDSCEIDFDSSFNVVTGETGAGKTALIEAIGLCLGERADSSLIRKDCEKAFVETSFDISTLPQLQEALGESGLESDEELIIRREISKEGKNRAFINCRMVPLPLLQKIGAELIDLIGQSAHQTLKTNDSQRATLDLFGSIQSELKAFQTAFSKQKELQKTLDELKSLSSHRERDEDTWRYQLEEIESVNLKQHEEEEVFEKYKRLANSHELSEKIDMIIQGLSEGPHAVLPQVSRFIKAASALTTFDSSLSDTSSVLNEVHIGLNETLRTLQSYSQTIDGDPNALQLLEQRLNAISRLKRKYGQTFEEIEAFKEKIKTELERLVNLSDELKAAETGLQSAKAQADAAAITLSEKRKKEALKLQKTLTAELKHLNMSGAELTIEVTPQQRSSTGDDLVQFWLKANTGEHPGLVKEHSSGGELSRLLFAIKVALAEKNNTPTLIFDEIDANVGGKTATIIGEKLHALGKHRQVICITHFPQVASKATAHFSVQKIENSGRTLTEIKLLSKKERDLELLRMIGGTNLITSV